MMRGYVHELVILLLIVIKERNNYRCRDSDRNPNAEGRMPEVTGKARHSCARHRFGGQRTARPTCAAWRCRGGCVNRLSQRIV